MAGAPEAEEGRTTKQSQVISRLRALADTLGPGAMLPTERSLADDWAVARMTVRGAIGAHAGGTPAVLPADRYELWFPLAAGPDGRLAAATGAP